MLFYACSDLDFSISHRVFFNTTPHHCANNVLSLTCTANNFCFMIHDYSMGNRMHYTCSLSYDKLEHRSICSLASSLSLPSLAFIWKMTLNVVNASYILEWTTFMYKTAIQILYELDFYLCTIPYAFLWTYKNINYRKAAWPEGDAKKGIVIAVTRAPMHPPNHPTSRI